MNGPIYIKSKALAVEGVRFSDYLKNKHKSIHANQLGRAITSVGANIHEAHDAESKNDFIHKLKVAKKELNESIYWVEILSAAYQIAIPEELSKLLSDCLKLLSSIIATTKRNMASKSS